MILSYKYKIRSGNFGSLKGYQPAVNYVWNYLVSLQKETQKRYREGSGRKWFSRFGLQRLTVGTSRELGIHAHTVQEICFTFA